MSLDRSTRLYVSFVIFSGLAVVPIGLAIHPTSPTWVLVYLAIGTQVASLMPITWSRGGTHTVTTPLLIAAGLFAPGAGVALVAWLCRFDGRRPGRDISWWAFLFSSANLAITYGLPSLVLTLVEFPEPWSLPAKTVIFTLAVVAINYPLTARVVGRMAGRSTLQALIETVGFATLKSMMIMGFSGGMLFLVLQRGPVGQIMALGFFGILIAIRANLADVQRQTVERLQTLQLAAETLDARDPYTEKHSQRVADLAARLGDALGLTGRQLEQLHTAGALHDLGKIGIRDDVLNKAERLTDEEWEIMKRHPDIGADMIGKHSALEVVAPMVRAHHERWNGTGYPQGLQGEGIPMGARILAVADSYDTIATARIYRPTHMTPLEAIEDITQRAGTWYDPVVVNALRQLHSLPLLPLPESQEARAFTQPGTLRLLWLRPRYTRLLVGSAISSLGDPMTTVASLVSVFNYTHDATAVAGTYVVKAIATVVVSGLGGALPDRIKRGPLIIGLEVTRALLLIATPGLLSVRFWSIYPILFALAGINAIVTPARQAVLPELVEPMEVGPANAGLSAAVMIAAAVGYASAGAVLWVTGSSVALFVLDGLTFAIAGLMIFGLGDLGGGIKTVTIWTGLITAWNVTGARIHLIVAGLAAFFLSMQFPSLIALAYKHVASYRDGAQMYTILEVMLAMGVVIGSLLVARMSNIGSLRTVAQGLAITGILSVGVAITPWIWLVAILLLLASAGNPIYTVGSLTALMDASDSSNRGTLMSSRFAMTQFALILGATTGALVTRSVGPEATFGVLGVGLIGLAVAAGAMARERNEVAPATQQ